MPKLLILILIFSLFPYVVWGQAEESKQDELGSHFTGRISRLNAPARLARIRTDFVNIKFLFLAFLAHTHSSSSASAV